MRRRRAVRLSLADELAIAHAREQQLARAARKNAVGVTDEEIADQALQPKTARGWWLAAAADRRWRGASSEEGAR